MRTFIVWLTMSVIVASAGAAEIWAIGSSSLIRFDSATPESVTLVGNTGVGHMQGMDFHPNGTLFGVTNTDLYTLSTATGLATRVGTCGFLGSDVPLDMSWDPVAQRMYVVGGVNAYSPMNLYTVDLETGAATALGALVNLVAPATPMGLATNAAGVRYVHCGSRGGMYRLDGLNCTFMGLEGPVGGVFEGMTIDWSGNGQWYHGLLNSGTSRVELWTVNEATGVGTYVGRIGTGQNYLIGDLAVVPVPEPTSVLLTLVGWAALRRR